MAADRAAGARPAPRPRPARARLGDRAPPPRRRRRDRPLAHPPLRHRPLPRPPNRHQAATATRSPLNEIPRPRRAGDHRRRSSRPFTEVKPDLSLELRIDALKLTFDLLVELDLTARPSYNRDKFLAYDAFLCGWSLAHPRYQTHGTRPAVVFVCPDPHAALALRTRGRRGA